MSVGPSEESMATLNLCLFQKRRSSLTGALGRAPSTFNVYDEDIALNQPSVKCKYYWEIWGRLYDT